MKSARVIIREAIAKGAGYSPTNHSVLEELLDYLSEEEVRGFLDENRERLGLPAEEEDKDELWFAFKGKDSR